MRSLLKTLLSVMLVTTACLPVENPRPDGGDVIDAGDQADAGEMNDAGVMPDAGGDVDWRQVRGDPWQTTVVGEYPGALPYAITDGGFVLVKGCDAGACDYEFRARDGSLKQTRTGLRSLNGTTVSPRGDFASLFEGTPLTCTTSDGSSTTFWTGSWHLVELDTGDSRATISPLLTSAFIEPAFLRLGLHARVSPVVMNECDQLNPLLRATTPPYAAPAAESRLGLAAYVSDELADGSLVGSESRNGADALTLLDARGASFDRVLNGDVTNAYPSGGFTHATTRQPAQSFSSFDFGSKRVLRADFHWTLRDYLYKTSSDRYAVFCAGPTPTRRCEVRDGLQERDPVVIDAQAPMAVAGKSHFVVYAHDDQLWRRSLLTGEETLVHPRLATVRTVGGGRAVSVIDGDTVLAVSANSVFTFPGALRGTVEALGASHDASHAATMLVITASASGGENWLHAWNTETGRIARLTDSLFFNPPFMAPLVAAEVCNAPGFVRSAGWPAESGFVQTKLIHFTEFVAQAQPLQRLFVMPVDLSAPPRLIAEGPSGFCGTPLATPSGDRLWLPVPMPTGGVRGVMATP